MDALTRFILGHLESSSPDDISRHAERVATDYVNDRIPLNQGITKVANDNNLNAEQVKRVVEKANNETFNLMLKAGYDKNITFDVADFNIISKALTPEKEQVKTASYKVTTLDYSSVREERLLNQFKPLLEEELEKVASAEEVLKNKTIETFLFKKAATENLTELVSHLNLLVYETKEYIDSSHKTDPGLIELDSINKFASENSIYAHRLLFENIQNSDKQYFDSNLKYKLEEIDRVVDLIKEINNV